MPNRIIISYTIGGIIFGTGIWCLYLVGKSALLPFSTGGLDGMPVDVRIMAFISLSITIIFSSLFLFSGLSIILRSKDMQINYRPTLLKLAFLAVLIILSIISMSGYEATSKVTWAEHRGLPFSFLTMSEIRGICQTGWAIGQCRLFENLNPQVLIIDGLVIYIAVCISFQMVNANIWSKNLAA